MKRGSGWCAARVVPFWLAVIPPLANIDVATAPIQIELVAFETAEGKALAEDFAHMVILVILITRCFVPGCRRQHVAPE